jgi:hypothetical protein
MATGLFALPWAVITTMFAIATTGALGVGVIYRVSASYDPTEGMPSWGPLAFIAIASSMFWHAATQAWTQFLT